MKKNTKYVWVILLGYVKYLKQLIKLIYKYSDLWEKWNNDD